MEVQLKQIKRIEVQGTTRTFYPGDWVNVGKQIAMRWIDEGAATVPNLQALYAIHDIGVVCPIKTNMLDISTAVADRELVFNKNIFWDGVIPLQNRVIRNAAHLLNTWHILAPMREHFPLASEYGTPEEQALTRKVIRELRVPVYEHRLVFAQRCPVVREFLEVWRAEEGTPELAFLRAVYKVKPLILPLPYTWAGVEDKYA